MNRLLAMTVPFALHFNPWVDLPLFGLVLGTFLFHFERWAKRQDVDTSVELESRLPSARIRLISLFGIVTITCWTVNFPAWLLLALIVLVSVGTAAVSDFEQGVAVIPWIIREWAFRFPYLILQPPPVEEWADGSGAPSYVGRRATVVTPLRPHGQVELDGRVFSAVSETGAFIAKGETVLICDRKKGTLTVRSLEAMG